jgi:hypothetical protein
MLFEMSLKHDAILLAGSPDKRRSGDIFSELFYTTLASVP